MVYKSSTGGGGGGGTPGGSNTQVQYNNNGVFGGISGFTSDGTSLTGTTGFSMVTPSGQFVIYGGALSGTIDNIYIGSSAPSTGAFTTLAAQSLTVSNQTNQIVLGTTRTLTLTSPEPATSSRTLTLPDPGGSDSVAYLALAQTLTNKRVTKRVTTAADAVSITPNTDSADITYQSNSQVAGTLTINADAGTGQTEGQSWLLKVTCTNAQTLSFNAIYKGGTTALPTATTGGSKTDYYTFIWDSVNSVWRFTGQALGF